MAISKETKVGVFVLAGLFIAGLVIFLIGDEKRAFDSKVTFHVTFSDVQGLKAGAPIRLGGIDIGTVGFVGHGSDIADARLYVTLNVVKSESPRIRKDTVAHVANRGLLGDKMIELSGGDPKEPPVPPEGTIRGEDPTDFTNLFNQVGTMAAKAESVLTNLETTTHGLADEQMQRDLRDTVHATSLLMRDAATGKGYVHRLLTDPAEADRVSSLVGHLDHTADSLDATLREARSVIAQIEHGPGLVHELVYGQESSKAVAQLGGAAGEITTTLRAIREGNGMAHGLLFGGNDAQAASADFNATMADLHAIVADMRAGKGTLGALLVDPSVYEDMKSILGNVDRNDVLRALVRYSIKQDEKRPSINITRPESPAGDAPGTGKGAAR